MASKDTAAQPPFKVFLSYSSLDAALAQQHPTLVGRVVPRVVTWFRFVNVLRRLSAEEIGIGDTGRILAALAEDGPSRNDTVALAERARRAFADQITARFTGGRGVIPVLRLSPEIETQMREAIKATRSGAHLALNPQLTQYILSAIGHVEHHAATEAHEVHPGRTSCRCDRRRSSR